MIEITKTQGFGFEPAIRGMRNAFNSWDKSDSKYGFTTASIGKADHDLMMKLRNAGTDHRKFMRMIVVYADILAPRYWWAEYDTYKVGTVANSCSTMHTIANEEFSLDDFSCEHMTSSTIGYFRDTIYELNFWRDMCLSFHDDACVKKKLVASDEPMNKRDCWYQMIQLLPQSYNQKRTVMVSYEALANMYHARKNHKLDEWKEFCKWVETLPYAELITGEQK